MDIADMQDRGDAGYVQCDRAGRRRWLPLGLLFAASAIALFLLYRHGGLSFQTVSEHSQYLRGHVDASPFLAGIVLFLLYTAVTALSLPIASLVTVVAGYLFGTFVASVWVVSGATLGSVVVFPGCAGRSTR